MKTIEKINEKKQYYFEIEGKIISYFSKNFENLIAELESESLERLLIEVGEFYYGNQKDKKGKPIIKKFTKEVIKEALKKENVEIIEYIGLDELEKDEALNAYFKDKIFNFYFEKEPIVASRKTRLILGELWWRKAIKKWVINNHRTNLIEDVIEEIFLCY